MKKALLVLALSLNACAPVTSPSPTRSGEGIIGGERLAPTSEVAQHVVALVGKTDQSQFLCTGVLIGADTILSAGHCAAEMKSGRAVFSTDLSTATQNQLRTITSVEVQPKYQATVERLSELGERPPSRLPKNWGDVSIMHFSGGVPRGYSPAAIEELADLQNGQAVILAGYGLMGGNEDDPPAYLNAVEVPIKNAKFSRSEFSVDQTHGKGACHGDSGGPAFAQNGGHLSLIGITSRGSDTQCKHAGIYTSVAAFRDWIRSEIK